MSPVHEICRKGENVVGPYCEKIGRHELLNGLVIVDPVRRGRYFRELPFVYRCSAFLVSFHRRRKGSHPDILFCPRIHLCDGREHPCRTGLSLFDALHDHSKCSVYVAIVDLRFLQSGASQRDKLIEDQTFSAPTLSIKPVDPAIETVTRSVVEV